MKVHINGKDIELKYSFRGFMIYEKITGESFNPKGITEMIIYFYSCLLASDKSNQSLGFEEFTDFLDDNPQLLGEFSEWLSSVLGVKSYIQGQNSETTDNTPEQGNV